MESKVGAGNWSGKRRGKAGMELTKRWRRWI